MRRRRRERKDMDRFMKDHCWGWRPPRKLRKIRYTEADLDLLYALRAADIEAGRQRMVARGLLQYAKPEELVQLPPEQIVAFEKMSGRKLAVP